MGRDSYANFPVEAKKVAIAGDFSGPSIEQTLTLRPDLVIVQGETSNRARFEDWQAKIGVPVAALTSTDFPSLARAFGKIGAWTGKTRAGAQLQKQFAALLAPKDAKKLRALVGTGDTSLWIAGRGTLVSDAAARAGYANIADDLKIDGYQQVNLESLLANQPDVYIVPSQKKKSLVLSQLRQNPSLSKLKCVQQGRVVVVDGDLLLRPGPRLLQGVAQLRAARTF